MAMLNPTQLTDAQSLIDGTSPGIYELKKLYGKEWLSIQKPTVLGGAFKNAVITGQLKNIRLLQPNTNNHQKYEIGIPNTSPPQPSVQ